MKLLHVFAAGLTGVLLTVSVAPAGVAITHRDNLIRVVAGDTEPDRTAVLKTSAGPDAFDETVNDAFTDGLRVSNASASQESSASRFGAFAMGSLEIENSQTSGWSRAFFGLNFEVKDEPVNFYLHSSVDPEGIDSQITVQNLAQLSFFSQDTNTAVFPQQNLLLSDSDRIFNEFRNGVLQPGRYSLSLAVELRGTGNSAMDYRVTVDFADAGPNAVPLPPAVWTGLVMLGGIAIRQYRRRHNAEA